MCAAPYPSVRAMTIVLRVGTIVSTSLLAAGVAVALVAPSTGVARTMLTAGLVILMATPVAHLVVALADEIAAREWRFVATGMLVLALLGGSLVVAFS